ncbi:hypothetical protein GCM10027567_32120 [Spongiibacter taiwanensis]
MSVVGDAGTWTSYREQDFRVMVIKPVFSVRLLSAALAAPMGPYLVCHRGTGLVAVTALDMVVYQASGL